MYLWIYRGNGRGRGQVKETTIQVTTPWKNKKPNTLSFLYNYQEKTHPSIYRSSLHSEADPRCPLLGIPPRTRENQKCGLLFQGMQSFPKNLVLTLFLGLCYNKDYGVCRDLQTGTITVSSCKLLSPKWMTQQSIRTAALTYDVMAAVRAGMVLQ